MFIIFFLSDKILFLFWEYKLEDAEIVIIAYGGVSRSAKSAVDDLRKQNIKAGLFRPITIWPFLEKQVNKVSLNAKEIYVAEMNLGQYVLEVERIACKNCTVKSINKVNGELITPEEIVKAIGGNK